MRAMKMKTSASPVRAQRGRSRIRVAAVVSAFAIILTGGIMIGTSILSPRSGASDAEIYTGVIRLPPDRHGACRQFEFDNRSAAMRSVQPAQCGDDLDAPMHPDAARTGGSVGRMNGIGRYFKQP